MLSPEHARIHAFRVVPSLPEKLQPLMAIARNLWWAWHPEAVELFVRIDRDLWRETHHNPIKVLGSCPQARLEQLADDAAYLAAMERVHERLQLHTTRQSWFQKTYGEVDEACFAYFSAEFGLTESLQVYSGGLGVLAGDHLKSASELGLPLIAVGLMYRHGYFQQYLNADGWQQEFYPDLDFTNLPIEAVKDANGNPIRVQVDLAGRNLTIAVWEAHVGRVRLFLLDTNLAENDPADRQITSQLYGGDTETRIRQEIVLGIGGVRALRAIGIKPSVWHMNEGHAAFLALERIREIIAAENVSFDEARWAASSNNQFTTHTPVPAGIDRFSPDLLKRYFISYAPGLKLDFEGLLALGRENVYNKNEFFSMAVLALRTSDGCNGVAKLHGEVSRSMWKNIWPGLPEEEVPIGHVTNGIHIRSWASPEMIRLFDRYLDLRWQTDPHDQTVWEQVRRIPDEELWRAHTERKSRLIRFVRRHAKQNLRRRGAGTDQIVKANELLDHEVLTIGFARRFATYKRANLLLKDPDRLLRLIRNETRPVQFVFAGKAHPADHQGKELIRNLVQFARTNNIEHRFMFVENYDMNVGRYLVQGVDVWLNNPRRPNEASGTSGMKAVLNGVPNLSILDGWWDEGFFFHPDLGWTIGNGETYDNHDQQDDIESRDLYDTIEGHVAPLFYSRSDDGLPRRWIQWMRNNLMHLAPYFNTNRMVQEYTEKYYMPLHERGLKFCVPGLAKAKQLNTYKGKIRANWSQLGIESLTADTATPLGVEKPMPINAVIQLGSLLPADVKVQIYYGTVDSDGLVRNGKAVDMQHAEKLGDGRHRYQGMIAVNNSGLHGFAVRIIPGHPDLATPFEPGLIVWDQNARVNETETQVEDHPTAAAVG